MKGHLRRTEDIHGRPIFTDEQMVTYLKQFERDFATAPQTILDATEGGVRKEHATITTLAEALKEHATRPVPKLPIPSMELDKNRLGQMRTILRDRLAETKDLRMTSQKSITILRQMQEHQRDQARVSKLFQQLNKMQRHVEHELAAAFNLVNSLNTIGTYKRAKADRSISHVSKDQFDRQTQQISRDIENLDWLTQACDEALSILDEARQRVDESYEKAKPKPAQPASIKTTPPIITRPDTSTAMPA